MKIGIDARFYGPRQKGLGRYLEGLINYLQSIDQDNQYIIFLRKENWSEFQPSNPRFKKVLADYPWYSWSEQLLFPLKIIRQRIDLIHFPHFNLPLLYPGRFVVTIHDLILRKYPTPRASRLSLFLYGLKNLVYRLVIWSAIKRAQKIIAISQETRQDILNYFKIKPEKIQVIYQGCFNLVSSTCRIDEGLFERQGINKPYLLYVGNAYPHKNLEALILAFRKLVAKSQWDLQLVLVGQLDYFYQRLRDKIKSRSAQDLKRIIFTGFLSDAELSQLYQKALLYVFPSLCEGFGLPALEAMAHRLPVVSSSASCLPEVLGQAAFYFDPRDVDQIYLSLKRVLSDRVIQKKLIAEGQKKLKEYHWSKTARQTKALYEAVG